MLPWTTLAAGRQLASIILRSHALRRPLRLDEFHSEELARGLNEGGHSDGSPFGPGSNAAVVASRPRDPQRSYTLTQALSAVRDEPTVLDATRDSLVSNQPTQGSSFELRVLRAWSSNIRFAVPRLVVGSSNGG